MPQVQVIQPIQQQPKRLRVAAYARVSSDSEDQLNSLAVQVDYYTHLIQENPNWEFAGIYTDEGITGTSTKRREQFNRLMDDCRAGLIDRVLVKSASRFARNTADALSSVRELKSLGVTVAFEKEGFDTETSNGEMLLSIICAVAQEESLSISQNMKWGIHKRMRTGNYITNATPFGYTQINHQLVPEKNNAMIVNDIFKSYLSGMSINEIAEHLNTIYPKENSKWNPRTIHAILRNEKYIGDSLYQKTYTTDSLPLKRYLNTGQRSKYYAMETHEGIISKTDYEKVQNLLAKKSITGEIDRTCVFSKKIYCSIYGKSSANRIAQYEMGYRSPKANRLKEIAKAMNIREEIFLMPDETPIDLLRILIWYDWEHEGVLQLATSRTANTPPGKTVSPIIYSEQLPLNRLLLDWADQKHSLSVRKITRADYLEWMLQWPPRLP